VAFNLYGKAQIPQAKQAAEKVRFVIPSEARDLLFFSASKKKQIPRANSALRNDMVRVFPQPVMPVLVQICEYAVGARIKLVMLETMGSNAYFGCVE